MTRARCQTVRRVALGLAWTLAAGATSAQTAAILQTKALAATCAGCHGTEGHAVAGEAMPRLAGLSKEYIVTQLLAFRDGKRPATVMHQLSKGYSAEQIEALAGYLATRK